MTAAAPHAIYPRTGRCSNCGRDRNDLFWHEQDDTLYCADTFRCDARLEILAAAGRFPQGRPEHLSGVSS